MRRALHSVFCDRPKECVSRCQPQTLPIMHTYNCKRCILVIPHTCCKYTRITLPFFLLSSHSLTHTHTFTHIYIYTYSHVCALLFHIIFCCEWQRLLLKRTTSSSLRRITLLHTHIYTQKSRIKVNNNRVKLSPLNFKQLGIFDWTHSHQHQQQYQNGPTTSGDSQQPCCPRFRAAIPSAHACIHSVRHCPHAVNLCLDHGWHDA